jgi:beta-lactam-binding protein with PASTA domain
VLDAAAMHAPQITYAPTGEAPRGAVVQQTPAAGTRIETDVAVTLTVAQ